MIEIKINGLNKAIDVLTQIAQKTEHKTDLMCKIAETMQKAVQQNFEESGRPAWLGLKYRQGKPLMYRGGLRSSINSAYDNDVAVVGTDKSYAAIHQFGGKAGRGKKVNIPARPFLMLTPQDEEDIFTDVQTYFQSLIN